MNKEKVKNTLLVVLTTGLVGMTIAYATFTSQLLIKDNDIIIGNDSWDIHFANGKPMVPYGNTEVIREPDLSNSLITNLSAKFNAPGDYVEYNFDIKNAGSLDAVLGSIVYSVPTCTSSITDEASAVCEKFSYKVINNQTHEEFKMGDQLPKGSSVPATLKISYDSGTTIDLTEPVLIKGFSILFTYYQQ